MTASNKIFSRFLIVWIGQFLSRIGSGISAFALGIYLFQKTGSTFTYSFFLLCAFLPSVLFAPVGGVIADRMDRKLMMIFGDLGASIGVLFIIIMLLSYPEKQWPVYLGIILISMSVALHSPAFKASVSDLLDEKSYSKASGLIQFAEASRYILAPVIVGYLLNLYSLPLVLAIDMFTFILGAAAVFLVKSTTDITPQITITEGFKNELSSGLLYIVRSRFLLRLLYLTIVVTFLTGILQVLLVPLVLSFTDVKTLGVVQTIAASGMLVSSVLIGMFSKTVKQFKTLLWSLSALGLLYALVGASSTILVFTSSAFCLFFMLPFVNTSLEVLFRQNIPNEMQGRVWSLITLISQTGMLVALSITGLLADNVFNPLLTDNGFLAETFGRIIGTGAARGSGLMVIIAGILLVLYTLLIAKKWFRTTGFTQPTPAQQIIV